MTLIKKRIAVTDTKLADFSSKDDKSACCGHTFPLLTHICTAGGVGLVFGIGNDATLVLLPSCRLL